MIYSVLYSETFKKQYKKLPQDIQTKIKKNLRKLGEDPLEKRSGADIKKIKDTNPPKHRLRVGNYRIIYYVENNTVKLIEIFIRGRGYRE